MGRATIKDIAAAAEVSLATASRALSGTGSVSHGARERVLAAAEQLGYVPNGQARALRSERTQTIGLLIPDVRNLYFAELAHEIELALRQDGLSLVLCTANEDPEQMRIDADLLLRQRVDGIIIAPFFSGRPSVQKLLDAEVPLVFVDRTIDDMGVPAVISSTRQAITDAVEDLRASGARRIGYISGPSDTSTGRERKKEFCDAATAFGLEIETVDGDFRERSGTHGMNILLSRGVDAVLAADSSMTLGAVRACLDRSLVPGRDIALTGFDDVDQLSFVRPTLPLVCQDIGRMARIAVERLRQQLAGVPCPTRTRIDATFRTSRDRALPTARDQGAEES